MSEQLLAIIQCYEFIERMTKTTLYVTIDGKSYLAKDLYNLIS
jgi:hypothetical protein